MKKRDGMIFTHKKSRRWLIIPATAVILLAISAFSLFVYVNARIHKGSKPITPSRQTAQMNSSVTQADETLLKKLDAGDYSAAKQRNIPILQKPPFQTGIENILLIGTGRDATGGGPENSAFSLVNVSLNKDQNSLKLVSLSKNTDAFFAQTDSWHRLNSAYGLGGGGMQVNIINSNYGLDIQKYVIIDYDGFKNIVDALGGIRISLSGEEAQTLQVGNTANEYTLNGNETLSYLKGSGAGAEESRSSRAAVLTLAAMRNIKSAGTIKSLEAANECLSYIKTNIPTADLLSMLFQIASAAKNTEMKSMPEKSDGLYSVRSSAGGNLVKLNWAGETKALKIFLYGKS